MNQSTMPPEFRTALRAALIAHVDQHAAPTAHRRRRLWIGVGVLGTIGALGGAGAATANFLGLPGSTQVATVADSITATHTGTASLELGPAPANATHISVALTCETAGTFYFPDGASMSCSAADLGREERYRTAEYSIPIATGQQDVTIEAPDGGTWKLTAAYTNEKVTDLAVNDNGETYGVAGGAVEPDLIAVNATNGKQGYVRADELAEVDGTGENFSSPEEALAWSKEREGKTFPITVYQADGETIIGEFVVG